ncbi:putative transcriptional regulator [Caulobacter ginsengisoli]|uniref:Transcriptional regulator n=1 Tax=Caulobacter ginsengisoli TaxID=400775 RepID=A0ABU0ITQ9_9CAUL|nr:helix-turn-helix domain-containing protein [Caulobacter ginsengisoli]MDQ0464533.1 putative transcriptional regulator [Caulobacter ginsengisoli]
MARIFDQNPVAGLAGAVDYPQERPAGVRRRVVDMPDVKALRETLRMSQQEFSWAYRIPLATLKTWEQGRRQPDATAIAFLTAIERLPDEIRAALKA